MAELSVVMYHYVRDLPRTRFPHIKGMLAHEFRDQVRWLASHFEMAGLECALAFLRGEYCPRRDLCMLTFDDGLKDHFAEVLPVLAERGIEGLFGIITSCVEEHRVASVHMNHFLTAELDFEEYRSALSRQIQALSPGLMEGIAVEVSVAQRSYPLDTREMASFKFLVNFLVPADIRDQAIRELFVRYLGEEAQFARELYMSWAEIRELQSAGMLVAGHTHSHYPLSTLAADELKSEISKCRALLDAHLALQPLWPFSYPYGKRNSFSESVVRELKAARFDCAFDTEYGFNRPATPLFEIHRIDCKGAVDELQRRLAA